MTIKVTIGGVETLRLADIAPAIERTVLLRMSQVAYDAMQTDTDQFIDGIGESAIAGDGLVGESLPPASAYNFIGYL